jgi:hypothetical protein
MANRTFKILGKAFGESDSTVTVTIDGTTVSTTTVTTLGALPDDISNLDIANTDVIATFTLEMPSVATGPTDHSATVVISGSNVVVGPIHSDNAERAVANGFQSSDMLPMELEGQQAKNSASVNGAAVPVPADSGELSILVDDGSTLSFTLKNKTENVATFVPA